MIALRRAVTRFAIGMRSPGCHGGCLRTTTEQRLGDPIGCVAAEFGYDVRVEVSRHAHLRMPKHLLHDFHRDTLCK